MPPTTDRAENEVVVLVTGYGPFLSSYPKNASWEICSRLPDHLPATAESPTRVKIIKYERPVPVSYASVAALIPQLLCSARPKPDIVLHMGLAAGRTYYTLESQSTRGPYDKKRDMDGETFDHDQNERLWHGCPDILRPTFDFTDVIARCTALLGDGSIDVRPSDDPGLYLCGFIYYASMAWYFKRQSEERPVLFLHVPDCPTAEELHIGQQVTLATIRALVDSRAANGIVPDRLPTDKKSFILPNLAADDDLVGPGAVTDMAPR